ncbi:cytochrome P450 714C2-like [Pyrus ussuriensis x Pyrus communis]|uniref:Cytochrome P450 714C2-like n=1 Tax=Pyrus ussuriensis x Pyrus communis TaxID=2448454 RepID=A0A5N5FZG0_9ROSA|nr:cytochrome P450 714C2-like [Pyrus ussuriensis x Pyrus communis]
MLMINLLVNKLRRKVCLHNGDNKTLRKDILHKETLCDEDCRRPSSSSFFHRSRLHPASRRVRQFESERRRPALKNLIRFKFHRLAVAGGDVFLVSATWCLMLLASNQEWQDRVRPKALQVCQGHIPDAEMAFKDMKFGDIQVPKGINVWIMVITLHTDPELWGPDSYAFNPNRFANRITGACKLPHLYMPFEVGP